MANSDKDIIFGADLLPLEGNVYYLGSDNAQWIAYLNELYLNGRHLDRGAMTVSYGNASSVLSLTTSYKKIPMTKVYGEKNPDAILTPYNGGIKCGRAGTVTISAAIATTGVKAGDAVWTRIYINTSEYAMYMGTYHYYTGYQYDSLSPTTIDVSAGDVIYLYTKNSGGARGNVPISNETRLTVQYVT